MTTTTTPQGVPIPAGVERVDDWRQQPVPLPYRLLLASSPIDRGTNYTTVQATAFQFTDGRIDDGKVHEPPHVYFGDDCLTSAQGSRTRRAARRGSRPG